MPSRVKATSVAMSWPWSASNCPRASIPGSRSSAASARDAEQRHPVEAGHRRDRAGTRVDEGRASGVRRRWSGGAARPSCSRRRGPARSGRSRPRCRRYRIATRSFSAFTNTKNEWPSSSIRATASSSNIGSMLKRLTLTIRPADRRLVSARRRRRSARRRAPSRATCGRGRSRDGRPPGARSCRGRRRCRPGASARPRELRSGLAVDDERDVDDVRILGAPVLLDGELDGRVRSVIEEALQPAELALRVARERAPEPRSSCP